MDRYQITGVLFLIVFGVAIAFNVGQANERTKQVAIYRGGNETRTHYRGNGFVDSWDAFVSRFKGG